MNGWQWVTGASVIHGPLHEGLIAGAFLGLAALLVLGRGRGWWRLRVPLAVAGAAVLLGGWWLLLAITKPWPDPLSADVYAWIGAGLLGVTLAVACLRRRRWWARGLAVVAAVVVVAGAADGVDTVFGEFPTVATALQLPPPDTVSAKSVLAAHPVPAVVRARALEPGHGLGRSWHPHDLPEHGAVFSVTIPPVTSGFAARPAWIYLPPAYLTRDRPRLPVLEMIGGQPGNPRNWLDGGKLAQRMDAWADAHEGLAPIVVMPDALGSTFANPLCLDSRLGRDDTYLSQDVPHWVTHHLLVDPDHAHWAVGGMSFGGTCALQLAVAHPGLFPTLFDAEGQDGPTLGSHARTVAATFGGDEAAFDAVDPLHELAQRRYPSSAAIIVVGAWDHLYRPQQQVVAAACRAAGMSVALQVLPGGHSWSVSGPALSADLPWLTARMGLPS